MKKIFVQAVAVLFLYSCQQQHSHELTNNDKTRIAEEIKKVTNSIFENGNKKDAAALYSNFSDSTTGIFSGTIMDSWEEHKKTGANFFASQKEVEYKIESMTVKVLSADIALLFGKYTLKATDSSGVTTTTNPALTYVFAREEGKWKVINFHDSQPINK